MRILVIDDDPSVADAMPRCVATLADTEAVVVASDKAALAALSTGTRFDIALVSVDGGGVSGLGLFRRLVERSLRVPRVALTAERDIARAQEAMADGAAAILTKPLDTAEFAATVTRVVDEVERRRKKWHERSAYMALKREVDIAADMQRRVLPQQFPSLSALECGAIMLPARGIGGDFYDVFALDADRVGMLIADVSGKGIPAAFYMAIASTAMRSVAMSTASPGDCLGEVNEFLVGRDIPGMFVSVFYAVIDTRSWEVTCANAGHSAPLVCEPGNGGPRAFDSAGGPVMGILPGTCYEESRFALPPRASVLLYTDGVTEAYDRDRSQFGDARLAEVFAEHCEHSATGLVDALAARLASYAGGAEQHDDITAIAVRHQS